MSRYLLDTHVIVWLAAEPSRVPRDLRDSLEHAEQLCVSAASAYEIAQKVRLGRMPHGASLLARWDELMAAMAAEELPLSPREMAQAGSMAWEHRDPFDRMLVAQAQSCGLSLVTRDGALHGYPGAPCTPWP